jgi:hypothetical protein
LQSETYHFVNVIYIHNESLDRAVGIATGYGWTAEGLEFESRDGQRFSALHVSQAVSGAHPASYPMGTGDKAAMA